MKYCPAHCCWYNEKKCSKCVKKRKPHLRTRHEVTNIKAWKKLKKLGWTK